MQSYGESGGSAVRHILGGVYAQAAELETEHPVSPSGRYSRSEGSYSGASPHPAVRCAALTTELRIFSYLPNPRIWKATIAARLCGVELEVRGAPPAELRGWLWDFDARPLSDEENASATDNLRQGRVGFQGKLHKTDSFLRAHPFGTVPAAFSPDGEVGIFESNSIMRTVARLGRDRFTLYGTDAYSASRIDSFLDASLVFARDSQVYLLSMSAETVPEEVHLRASEAFETYLSGIEAALSPDRRTLVGDDISLADICFVAELTLFSRERAAAFKLARNGLQPIVDEDAAVRYPRSFAHYERLSAHEAFAPDVAPYRKKLEADVERFRSRT